MLFISVAVDIILTSVVSYRLWTARSGLSTETETLVTRVLAMTWQAAIPPMVSGVLEAVCFEVSLDTNLAYATFSFLTPRLYVCALMYTLNSRLSMRGMYNHDLPIHNKTLEQGMSPNEPHMSILGGPHAGSQQYGSAFPIRSKLAAEGLSRPYTPFELSPISSKPAIDIVIQQETIRHTSPSVDERCPSGLCNFPSRAFLSMHSGDVEEGADTQSDYLDTCDYYEGDLGLASPTDARRDEDDGIWSMYVYEDGKEFTVT
ncbi:hypothetical protein FRB95_007371 [Tulasnella sp. JGI-2019a]|nr:hypothetical protein FRB95_007371 [Tulasnella sp. JGI-2019a]